MRRHTFQALPHLPADRRFRAESFYRIRARARLEWLPPSASGVKLKRSGYRQKGASVCRRGRLDAGARVACAEFAVVFKFLSVFEQECRAQIRTFGAIQAADGFIAGSCVAILLSNLCKCSSPKSSSLESRHPNAPCIQALEWLCSPGIFIDMVNSLVENRFEVSKNLMVFFAGKG